MRTKLKFISFILIISLFMPIIFSNFQPTLRTDSQSPSVLKKLDLPLSIYGNTELNATASAGNGSLGNPYILENYVINASGLPASGITIENTNAYFILRNCTVFGATGQFGSGIKLINVIHG
ncbi:MAG: hypothetical protein HWN66_09965, partial [Candidatus Helarchaeota archaeon]|nr:hypothetical protein [Candidatus Helarchaeota archaeon]